MRICLKFALATALLSANLAAHADTFTFSYNFGDGNILGGSLTGTLQADGNTFDVSDYNSITYDGVVQNIAPTAFQSYTTYNVISPAVNSTGVVTINGSLENFIDFNTLTGNGFVLGVNFAGPGIPNDIVIEGFSTEDLQTFHLADFSASVTTAATPEPSSLILLGTGILGMAGAARRRFLTA